MCALLDPFGSRGRGRVAGGGWCPVRWRVLLGEGAPVPAQPLARSRVRQVLSAAVRADASILAMLFSFSSSQLVCVPCLGVMGLEDLGVLVKQASLLLCN